MEAPEHRPGFVDGGERIRATVTSDLLEASPQIVWQRLNFEADRAAA